MLYETEKDSSRIWAQVTVYIPYDSTITPRAPPLKDRSVVADQLNVTPKSRGWEWSFVSRSMVVSNMHMNPGDNYGVSHRFKSSNSKA